MVDGVAPAASARADDALAGDPAHPVRPDAGWQQVDDPLRHVNEFRRHFPPVHHLIHGATWETIAAGAGASTLLLLPGAMGYAETSFHYILAFAENYRVLALSYPPAIGTAAALCAGIVGVMDLEGIAQAHVVGGSYSGLVAQELAARYPQRVASLLLSNTNAPSPARARRYRLLLAGLWPLPTPMLHAVMQASIRQFLPAATQAQAFWRAYFAAIIPRFTRQELLNRVRVMIEMERRSKASSTVQPWHGPVLIVDAAGDLLVPQAQRAALHTLYPQARRVELSDAGHTAALERTAEYIELYQSFLATIEPSKQKT